jgi:Protein of unknown function (DUF1266)
VGILGRLKSIVDSGFKVLPDAPALSPAQERGLALGAVYAAGDLLPINALTAAAEPHLAAKVLDQSWDVHDAQSARGAYRFLLDGGGHRGVYACVRNYLNADWDLSRAEERARVEQATREIPALAMQRGERPDLALTYFQSAWPLRAVMQSGRPRRIVEGITAWDAARVVHVSRFIVDAGYLPPDEAWAAIDAAGVMVRPEYASWEEFQLGFLAGQVFWQGNAGFDAQEIGADHRRYISAGKSLLGKADSPWLRLPW